MAAVPWAKVGRGGSPCQIAFGFSEIIARSPAEAPYLTASSKYLTSNAIGKGLRVFRPSEAEHLEVVAVFAAQRVRKRRPRQRGGSAKYHLTVQGVPLLFDRERHVRPPAWPIPRPQT
jgi:hypothetical protein